MSHQWILRLGDRYWTRHDEEAFEDALGPMGSDTHALTVVRLRECGPDGVLLRRAAAVDTELAITFPVTADWHVEDRTR